MTIDQEYIAILLVSVDLHQMYKLTRWVMEPHSNLANSVPWSGGRKLAHWAESKTSLGPLGVE